MPTMRSLYHVDLSAFIRPGEEHQCRDVYTKIIELMGLNLSKSIDGGIYMDDSYVWGGFEEVVSDKFKAEFEKLLNELGEHCEPTFMGIDGTKRYIGPAALEAEFSNKDFIDKANDYLATVSDSQLLVLRELIDKRLTTTPADQNTQK